MNAGKLPVILSFVIVVGAHGQVDTVSGELQPVLNPERIDSTTMTIDSSMTADSSGPTIDSSGLSGESETAVNSPPGLFIEADVENAQVYIDGDRVGTTPLSLEEISPGEHVLHVLHPNVDKWVHPVVC